MMSFVHQKTPIGGYNVYFLMGDVMESYIYE